MNALWYPELEQRRTLVKKTGEIQTKSKINTNTNIAMFLILTSVT